MGDRSGIEWTDATWNPTSGCTKVSQGCKHCYAERVFPRAYAKSGRAFTDVAQHPDRLGQPLRWQRPRRIFVDSMSDLFHEAIPFDYIDSVFGVMALARQHTFQVLTKRPARMLEWFNQARSRPAIVECACSAMLEATGILERRPFDRDEAMALAGQGWPLPNVWLGVSVEDQATADERIPLLLATPATVRFLSMEPLLGPVDVFPYIRKTIGDPLSSPLDWVIVGGESGPKARPMHPDWARSLRDQCAAAGVPFFFKQWGEWRPICEGGGSWYRYLYRSRRLAREGENQAALDELWGQTCTVPQLVLHNNGAHQEVTARDSFLQGRAPMHAFRVGKAAAGRDSRWDRALGVPPMSKTNTRWVEVTVIRRSKFDNGWEVSSTEDGTRAWVNDDRILDVEDTLGEGVVTKIELSNGYADLKELP
jgi:protein gp37